MNGDVREDSPRLGHDIFPVRTDYNSDIVDLCLAHGIEHVCEQSAAGDPVQHFRDSGLHARALARGEDYRERPAWF
jgi:hypothetical protein